jgi:SAM-dependent methyltransferase
LIDTPIANELIASRSEAVKADTFPLEIVMCKSCKHVQLKHIVSKDRLFKNYVYQSGTSNFFQKHFREFAALTSQFVNGGKVLEIGSNDGTLLAAYSELGLEVIGIEPSKVLVDKCKKSGFTVFEGYFSRELIQKIDPYSSGFDLIVGNNVFAHIEDLITAFRLIKDSLKPGGVFVFEVAHLLCLVESGNFDSIYHEHMSYHSLYSLELFCSSIGLNIFAVEEVSSHGGSLRVFVSKNQTKIKEPVVNQLINREIKLGLNSPKILEVIKNSISETKSSVISTLKNLTENGNYRIIGYGAPAKMITFVFQLKLTSFNFLCIIDDNVEKQNFFTPVWGVKIVSREDTKSLIEKELEVNPAIKFIIYIFPWNLTSEIIRKINGILPPRSYCLWMDNGLQIKELA